MSHCPYCQKKIAMSKAFCSKGCKENYFQLIAIQIPKLFIRKLYMFCSEDEREKEIEEFAKRHNWRLDLLKKKIHSEAIKLAEKNYISKDAIE